MGKQKINEKVKLLKREQGNGRKKEIVNRQENEFICKLIQEE
jgi:hypothetical protein